VLGLVLASPTRSQVTVSGDISIVLDNPQRAVVSATFLPDGAAKSAGNGERCAVAPQAGTRVEITCHLGAGQFEVRLFGAPAAAVTGHGSYSLDYVGSILANSH